MNQETAQILFQEGAMLLFFDVPPGTEFGIGYNCWEVGPKFKGVKMIPPGVHFIYYSAKSKLGDVAPRTGFFYEFKQKEILVKKWDKQLEDIKMESISLEEMERYELNKEELDRFLAPYPYENYKKWVSLTDHITKSLICSLQPENEKISSVTSFESECSTSKSRAATRAKMSQDQPQMCRNVDDACSSMFEAESHLPNLKVSPGTMIHYSAIPKKYPTGATPSQITAYCLDSSYALETMITSCYNNKPLLLLGELQFSFVCFLLGQVYDAFEHWKKLVHLLSTSTQAVKTNKELFKQLISVLYFQLKEIPEDFFVDIVSQNNFLTVTLHELFCNLEMADVDPQLQNRALKFKKHLTETFQWDFSSEPKDFEPVIVSTEID